MPVPMSTVANRIRASGSDGSSGGGSTAAIAAASVSHTTVTAVDQIFAAVASTSRLRCCSGARAPYRMVMLSPSLDHLLGIERVARGIRRVVGGIERHAHGADGRADAIADRAERIEIEAVYVRGSRLQHHLRLVRRHVRERG